MKLRYVPFAIALVLLSSCEEFFFEPVPESTPSGIFDQVWSFADHEYSYFAYKGIDWDAVRQVYRARISEDLTDQELFDVLADMLYVLQDGHVNLRSPFDRSRNWQWFLDYDPNYDYSVLERAYFTDGSGKSIQKYVGEAFIAMDFQDPAGDVGYIHYRSFENRVRNEDMDYVIDLFAEHSGLIIDVRGNGGGSISNVYAIADRLTNRRVAVAHERVKNGPGHGDFAPARTLYLEPVSGRSTFTRPVVVLTNRECYSATNYFVTAVRELDQVTVMGDRTGGGGGVPANTQLTNGWGLRVSSTQLLQLDPSGTLTEDQRNVEHGLDPDISVASPEAELATGVDTILETALSYIRGL